MGQIKAAAMNFKTPFYVIHKNELDDNYKKLTSALEKHWNNYIIGCANVNCIMCNGL